MSSPRACGSIRAAMLGVCIVTLFNAVAPKISSFYVSLLSFVGQIFAGVALDALLAGAFSLPNLIGGVLVTAGAGAQFVGGPERRRAALPL